VAQKPLPTEVQACSSERLWDREPPAAELAVRARQLPEASHRTRARLADRASPWQRGYLWGLGRGRHPRAPSKRPAFPGCRSGAINAVGFRSHV